MIRKNTAFGCLLGIVLVLTTCKQEVGNAPANIAPGDDPNFTIIATTNGDLGGFNRKVIVFDIPIFAVPDVEDKKLLHAANVMAQYLDNDEDGAIDNQVVHAAMQTNNAFMVMWNKESDLDDIDPPNNAEGQDLGNDETIPGFVANGKIGRFDASLEEVWHIISHAGYASAYPSIFGEKKGTVLTNAMDKARGGQFTKIPDPYPANAWYSYDDHTCDYSCMATEYIYWALTSILGAQENRLNEISQEWDLNTRDLVQNTDVAVFDLLTDPQYKFPKILPDGTYKR